MIMKIKLIGCASTMNEVRYLGLSENMEAEYLDFNLHGTPAKLHEKLQEIINQSQDFDLIILTYSRCSNAVVGLVSPQVPLIFPTTHDCIGVLLGSHDRYMDFFQNNHSVYYFSQGWLDHARTPYEEYLEYEEKYGKENAKSLIDTLYGSYKKAVFIKTPGIEDIEVYREKLKKIADFFNWETYEVEGSLDLLSALLQGKEGKDIIRIEPGVKVTEDLLTKNNS